MLNVRRAFALDLEIIGYGLLLRLGRRHMKFVLVNGRTPFRQSFCGLCGGPIGEGGYLRDIRTRLCYCGEVCYALKSDDPGMPAESQAKAS